MTIGALLRTGLVCGLLAGATAAAAAPGATTVPGAAGKVHAAIVQQRHALSALPQSPGSDRGSYARPLAHVRAAVTDLLAVQSALATAARTTGAFPHMTGIQRLLDTALTGSGTASTQLAQAVWYIDHGAAPPSTLAAEARGNLRLALKADVALGKVLG